MVSLNQAYRLSKLLNIECIKKEVDSITEGFNIQEVSYKKGIHECIFINSKGERITLSINTIKKDITIIKQTNETSIRIHINQHQQLSSEKVEYRPLGIIYTITYKVFDKSKKFNNKDVLVDLMEKSYTFSKDTLSTFVENVEFSAKSLNQYLLRLSQLKKEVDLSKISDYHSEFSTHMNYYLLGSNGSQIMDNHYPTRTYLNGDEVSAIFDINDGEDKLYRTYDLYHGIINPRNENEIYAINLGLLTPDSYNLKALSGITNMEDSIVGKSLISEDKNYLNYLKEMLYTRTGFKGNLELNRDSILSAINYKMSSSELVKRQIEEKLGISYEEFEKMDYYKQQRLIEERTGKKIQPDFRLHIDGIPIDEDHIMTMDQVDRKIDELTATGPKKILKRLLNSFVKK